MRSVGGPFRGQGRMHRIKAAGKGPDIPLSIVSYVERTLEAVILEDGENSRVYGKDIHIKENHCKSVLCMPILSKGAKGHPLLKTTWPQASLTSEEKKTSCPSRHSWQFLSKTPIYMSICAS